MDTLWCIVYAVRNAFAHGIANPKWVVNRNYQRTFDVALEDANIIIDLATLNGRAFEYAHIGGFANWQKMKNKSFELLAIS